MRFRCEFLAEWNGAVCCHCLVVIKTGILYTIMVTGAIWEKVVFGRYLFAPAFFWEDVVSMGVIALHTLYLVMLLAGWGTPQEQMWIALQLTRLMSSTLCISQEIPASKSDFG